MEQAEVKVLLNPELIPIKSESHIEFFNWNGELVSVIGSENRIESEILADLISRGSSTSGEICQRMILASGDEERSNFERCMCKLRDLGLVTLQGLAECTLSDFLQVTGCRKGQG